MNITVEFFFIYIQLDIYNIFNQSILIVIPTITYGTMQLILLFSD